MDRRQAKTRQAVYEAFIRLLERKSYSGISVQEIIDEANIGRSTFYAHFETKDDLLKALCTRIFDHVFSADLMKERTHDFSSASGGIAARLTHILYHLRDSRSYLHGILSCESGEIFMRYFKEYLTRVLDKPLAASDPGVPHEYLLHHAVCGFAETVRWWFDHEQYTPEMIAGFYLAATPYFDNPGGEK